VVHGPQGPPCSSATSNTDQLRVCATVLTTGAHDHWIVLLVELASDCSSTLSLSLLSLLGGVCESRSSWRRVPLTVDTVWCGFSVAKVFLGVYDGWGHLQLRPTSQAA
jgi:hypothetical protein